MRSAPSGGKQGPSEAAIFAEPAGGRYRKCSYTCGARSRSRGGSGAWAEEQGLIAATMVTATHSPTGTRTNREAMAHLIHGKPHSDRPMMGHVGLCASVGSAASIAGIGQVARPRGARTESRILVCRGCGSHTRQSLVRLNPQVVTDDGEPLVEPQLLCSGPPTTA